MGKKKIKKLSGVFGVGNLMSRRDCCCQQRSQSRDWRQQADHGRLHYHHHHHLTRSLTHSLSWAIWPPAHLMLSSMTKLKRDFRLCFLRLLSFFCFHLFLFSTMFNQLSRYLLSVLCTCCPSFRIYWWSSCETKKRETMRGRERDRRDKRCVRKRYYKMKSEQPLRILFHISYNLFHSIPFYVFFLIRLFCPNNLLRSIVIINVFFLLFKT